MPPVPVPAPIASSFTPVPVPDEALPDEPVVEPTDAIVEETVYAPRRRTGARWRLTLPQGTEVEFATRAIAGRAPQAPEGWDGATPVVIDDPDRTVSKTHAGFYVDGDAVFVTDLDSTNGVAIVSADGQEIILERGQAVAIPEGADVELGSFAIRVERM